MCLHLICTIELLRSCPPSLAVAQEHCVHTKHPKSSNSWKAMKGVGPFRGKADNVLNRWCHFSKDLKEKGEGILAELSQSPPLNIAASWNKAKSVASTQCNWVYCRLQCLSMVDVCEHAAKRLVPCPTLPMAEFQRITAATAAAASVEAR